MVAKEGLYLLNTCKLKENKKCLLLTETLDTRGFYIPDVWCSARCWPNNQAAQLIMLRKLGVDLPEPPDGKDLLDWAKEHAKKMPPIKQQLKNAAKATGRAVKSGFKRRPKAEQAKCRKICDEPCEFMVDKILRRCSKCGCGLKIKVKMAVWHCPIDKW